MPEASRFLVTTCKPTETLERADRLRALVGSPEAVVAPFFRKTIRVGHLRRRRVVESPVLGGLIFVSEDAAGYARGVGGICSCRSEAAAVGGVVQMLTPWKDPVTGDRAYATVGGDELSPLEKFAAEKEAAFVTKAEADALRRATKASMRLDGADAPVVTPVAVVQVDTTGWIGRRAALIGGLMTGAKGTVKTIVDGEAVLDLDAGGWVSTITVPVELVQVDA